MHLIILKVFVKDQKGVFCNLVQVDKVGMSSYSANCFIIRSLNCHADIPAFVNTTLLNCYFLSQDVNIEYFWCIHVIII